MKVQKRPVIVDAERFTNKTKAKCLRFITSKVFVDVDRNNKPILRIQTLEGEKIASLGDWIIQGVNGEFYPCKPDIFAKTYSRMGGQDV